MPLPKSFREQYPENGCRNCTHCNRREMWSWWCLKHTSKGDLYAVVSSIGICDEWAHALLAGGHRQEEP